jgi:hypothetical protein
MIKKLESKYVIEKLQELNPEAELISDFDNCLVGYAGFRINGESTFHAVYDFEYIISELENKYELDRTEAIEYYYFNISNIQAIVLFRE